MPPPSAPPVPSRAGATIAAGFVHGMLSHVPAAGREREPLLAAAGISQADLMRGRVGLAHYARLYNLTVEALDDEGFALFSRPVPRGSFEFLCRAMLGAPHLGEALHRAARFLRLVLDDLRLALHTREGYAELLLIESRPLSDVESDPARIFAFEWLLRLLHAVACWFAARSIPLIAVDFPYPRPFHADDYFLVYTDLPRFGAPTCSAHIAIDALSLPLRRDDDALAAFLQDAPGKITRLYRRDRVMVQRVRDLLHERLPANPGLDSIAARLNLSPRTLARRLADEGSSFRAVKDALRRDIATARLARSGTSIARLAAELGYADPSAFYRAFTAWTGQSPERFRRSRTSTGKNNGAVLGGVHISRNWL